MADRLISIDTEQDAGTQLPATVLADLSARETVINVMDYGANPASPASHQAAFEAAFAAAFASEGSQVYIPAGEWHLTAAIEIPYEHTITVRGAGMEIYPDLEATPGKGTRIFRDGTESAFRIHGPASDLPEDPGEGAPIGTMLRWWEFPRNVVFQDIGFADNNPSGATEPLFSVKATQGLHFLRVSMTSNSACLPLLDAQGMAESRFFDCYFLGGGGRTASTPAVYLRGGSDDFAYSATNACTFVSCSIENYFGPALKIGDEAETSPYKANLLHFVNLKMECALPSNTGPHIWLDRAAWLFFENGYSTSSYATGKVMYARDVNGLYGNHAFVMSLQDGYVDPDEKLYIGADSSYIQFDVRMIPPVASDQNVVTMESGVEFDPKVQLRIVGDTELVNNKTLQNRWNRVQNQWQTSSSTQMPQYIFARTGYNAWCVGRVNTPSGDQQQFEVLTYSQTTGDQQSMLRLRTFSHTSGTDPSTATYRDMAVNAFINLPATDNLGWINFQNITPPAAPVGGHRLYSSSDSLTWDGVPLATTTGTETLTGKTLTAPVLNGPKVDVIYSGGSPVMQIAAPSAGNYFYVNSSSSNPSIQVVGSSSDINVNVTPKGAGTLSIYVSTGQTPTLEARGADANHDLNLVSKGTGVVKANGNPVGVKVAVPASAAATGVPGQWAADGSYIYVCTATNTWLRAAIATW